ncbi:hypothetical protein AVEN_12308-1 [Araneus ventricosus]|uniref:Uncharacterized protein n=1 Tax=Araneus ventricosus TaxID=182803 RepID=A0A4Y2EAP0_ARAVE|nr:hypothetical protein AVEN_12308-1 [Araneus ventricosus]
MGAQLYPRNQVHLNDVEASQLTRSEKTQSVAFCREGYVDSVLGREDVVLIDFLTSGAINMALYCDTLSKLKSAIRLKRSGLLSIEVLFSDDNARPHTARDTKGHILLGWERLDHPAYSPIRLSPFSCIEVRMVS